MERGKKSFQLSPTSYDTYLTCESNRDFTTKLAAAKAFPSVVGILSRNLPADMAVLRGLPLQHDTLLRRLHGYGPRNKRPKGELVFWGCGIIIECETDEEDLMTTTTHQYLSTIICPATLFVRTNGIEPVQIEVDVYLWDGKICKGQVLACDFHYNLAAVKIQSNSPLPTATLRPLDVACSILPTNKLPASNLFNISPGTKIITLARTYKSIAQVVGSGTFGTIRCKVILNCNELYYVENSNHPEKDGGAVINYDGEVIGLMFYDSPFLPINIVSSWWKHFKSSRQYQGPWIGVEIADLHLTCLDVLEEVMEKFPNVATGVFVTKVADSQACKSGIRRKDVIVECDGKLVRSTLELLDTVWNKVGESVDLDVLRASNGKRLKLSLAVKEITPDKLYKWNRTMWRMIPRS